MVQRAESFRANSITIEYIFTACNYKHATDN
jgi:hypothetical protein